MESRSRIRIGLAMLAMLGLAVSCQVLDPVDPYYNEHAHPPVETTLDIREIRSGQYLAGDFSFTVSIPDSIAADTVDEVTLFVDDSLVNRDYNPPFELELSTTAFPEGPHVISMGLRTRTPNLGLLNLFELMPEYIFTAPVVFDQSPPTAVTIDSVVWDDGFPRLYWQPNEDSNFFAYIIRRYGPCRPVEWYESTDSVFDRHSTSFHDPHIGQLYGMEEVYRIDVTNHASTALSDADTIRYWPIALSVTPVSTAWQLDKPILNPSRNILYAAELEGSNTTLCAISTESNTDLGSIRIPEPHETWAFATSSDGEEVYVLGKGLGPSQSPDHYGLTVLGPDLVNQARSFDLGTEYFNYSHLAAGRAGRLYVSGIRSGYGGRSIRIVNTTTGTIAGETHIQGLNITEWMMTSPDHNTLFVSGPWANRILRFDISTDSVTLEAQQSLETSEILGWQLSPDGSLLYVQYNRDFIEIFDALTLESSGRLEPTFEMAEDWMSDFWVAGEHVYMSVAQAVPGAENCRYFVTGSIREFDIETMTEHAHWDFVKVPHYVVASKDKRFLYAFCSELSLVVDTE